MILRLHWDVPEPPFPKHPYRDSAIFYAGLAVSLLRDRLG